MRAWEGGWREECVRGGREVRGECGKGGRGRRVEGREGGCRWWREILEGLQAGRGGCESVWAWYGGGEGGVGGVFGGGVV